ncbi:hypothetical protein QVD99_000092 [Batrachochytrium dendrobatidis]|nr:hypothetical protein O5D80_005541 [Batrachochytrium dendrobatidis]KAK5664430.1 hypothetical protein QVD99_000092 [Batrachochytrium dendrobatidis]
MPATTKKTDSEKAKAFLLKCYMTASVSLEVLDESNVPQKIRKCEMEYILDCEIIIISYSCS